MSSTNTLVVAVIGFPAYERHLLECICRQSAQRPRSYSLVPIAAAPTPAILFVDGDDPSTLTEWRTLCTHDETKATLPTVIASRETRVSDPSAYHLHRPLAPSRVLSTLDAIVIEGPTTQAETSQQYQILVVDDSLSIRKQVELELNLLGAETDCAESGEQALALLAADVPYDLIFLDVVLPGVDGYNLCKTIKKDRRRKHTPVIMLTGKDSIFDRVRGKLAGCNTYLTKPVAREEFRVVVKTYLSQLVSHEVAIS